ncbi:MAG: BamA/TamA family outer membrane protein [Elusimicrobia bacterium]|nr:BamA/TamA family outer membrane protein [Elusimicrobiota bacterium]
MIRRAPQAVLIGLLALAAAARAGAEDGGGPDVAPPREFPKAVREAPRQEEAPLAARWMIRPLRRGMFIRLPVVDTDPNRGVTYGVMPIWVLQGKDDDRIRHIHAPSLTFNRYFRLNSTYRYYYYPAEDAALVARASRSKYEREVLLQYEDRSALGSDKDVFLRVQNDTDAGQRFFGFGPDSPRSGEANYKADSWQYRWGLGTPLAEGSPLHARLSQHYQADRILDGPVPNLTQFRVLYPRQFADGRQQANETRLTLDYDTRDHGATTTRGQLVAVYAEASLRGFMSSYDYERYGLDARCFRPHGKGRVFAAQAKYDQVLGPTPPFWLLSPLGGKYSLRAYGDGRYVDRGAASLNVEERFTVAETRTAGVTTEFQLAPFAGVGAVFDNPRIASTRFLRPVIGGAVRAVARPQVVGSMDFGVGREGLAIFMDINYSF